jgi:serine protease
MKMTWNSFHKLAIVVAAIFCLHCQCTTQGCPNPQPASDCRNSAGPFTWSCDGPIADQSCIPITEAADHDKRDPSDQSEPEAWSNNFVCVAKDHPAGAWFKWSDNGPIDGMRCTQIYENAEPEGNAWTDNYVCVTEAHPGGVGSTFHFQWSEAGPIANKTCLQWNEPADPHAWTDNYLCW